jgi:rhamnosyltransferase
MNKPFVSIIMRSKNSDWVIASALDALYSQEYMRFELIVVDSGSTDNTLDILKSYPCRLIQIEPGDYYPGKVLNDAIELCSSEIIVFINSDSVMLSPKSLGNLLASFDNPLTSAAFGRQLPRPEAHTWVQRDYTLSFPDQAEAPDWLGLSLPLAAFRRTAWEQHPFYTDSWASEDTEWGLWAKRNGHKVDYVPSALTMHSHNYTLKEIYGRRFVEGEADAFIHQTKMTPLKACIHLLKSCFNDTKAHLAARDIQGLLFSPIRRAVYHWAYLKGNSIGFQRVSDHNLDTSIGQEIVLNSVVPQSSS